MRNYHRREVSYPICPVTFQHHPPLTFLSRDLDPLYHFLSCYFFFLCAFSPIATSPTTFFNGEISTSSKTNKSFMVLASSTMISWIFAKSVQNASVLGAKFGIAGGFGYASWYVRERNARRDRYARGASEASISL